ncbi:restriction endonuclease subunit S [Vibrio metschnikovii]|uniref:restriction endonuclease subunit S n=1 Tax=Vibrio TaxID=662 RepID=UPI0015598471|nr:MULTISPECIES: restriction endonuclease subunit S [Vibrio]EKO3584469.1 restriction endonuclease subunit S [Vibrio metschnikovii]EKO3445010.1 restriction endonuclease subunit S [Vibrio fluvialis]EKO3639714.1 restriction endonuclease subunit S [Vibrio metschnikovii]EKO3679443.1 restriction endonuclease subunit S [Vibrio metschnikovii]EKO3701544.1 restriction endonuclease subunit S [Vibrio metschnikovii]
MAVENLITEHIDIWTSAVKTKSTSGRGSSKKLELYGVNKLRELILELAVRGKLVPQDPNDEPASVLLERIAAEKAQLVKDGKIKKSKGLGEISEEDDRLKNIPSLWETARLGNLLYVEMGQSPASKYYNQDHNGVPFFQGKADFGERYPTARYWCVQPQKYAYEGDVLLSVRAPVGPTNISTEECCIGRGLAALRPISGVPTNYVYYMMQGFRKTLESLATGTTFVAVSKVNVENLIISVPPLKEQHRIVAKVDELMTLCDQLEQQTEASIEAHQVLVTTLLDTLTNSADADELMQNWARISEHFDTLFTTEESIDQLKQTILQLAVMGKLVPQDPSDEPAAELLKRITDEKAQLVKEKKIKKQKALPPIAEDEKPFELPNGWEWCRLPDLGELARGKSKHRPRNDPKLYENGNIPLVQTGDVARANGTILTYTAKYNEFGLAQSQLWPKGTLCITIAANIADTATLGFDACFPDSVVGYTPYDKEIPTVYFDYFIKTAKENLERFAPSTAQKNINLEILSNVLVPCPPKQQFPRIVEKVNLLLGICDELKERLKESQMSQLQLTDAIVEQAV